MGKAESKLLEHMGRGLDVVKNAFADNAAYNYYIRNRDLGISREILIGRFGQEPVERYEARFTREWNAGARLADDTIPAPSTRLDTDTYGRPLREANP